jgi:hypothetical protein
MTLYSNGKRTGFLMLFLTALILLGFLMASLFLTEGHWVYTLDDAYIHIQMAKNLATSGTWGLAPDTFTACSSAPLWTLCLGGCYALLGVWDCLPGILNFLACLSILLFANKFWSSLHVDPPLRILAGLGLLFLCPLTVIVSTGMEHTVHVLLILLFLHAVMTGLSETQDRCHISSKSLTRICLWATLATGIRYETWFLVLPALALLALHRQWRCCLCLFASASLPVLLFGFYSLAHGGFFLPNALLLKGRMPSWNLSALVKHLFSMYVRISLENVHLHVLCILMLLTSSYTRVPKVLRVGLLMLAMGCVIHLTVGECGWFYRYEAYLMAPGLILLGAVWLQKDVWAACLAHLRKGLQLADQRWVTLSRVALLFLLVTPLVLRGVWANTRIIRASANIYEHQWQLARIFKTFPKGQARVAINDLGVMSYQFSPAVLDLWGLGSTEITRLKYTKQYDREAVQHLLSRHQIDYIVVFDQWFSPRDVLPQHLILVAKLRHPKNIVCLEDTAMLYATNREQALALKHHLEHLPFKLPRETRIEPCF